MDDQSALAQEAGPEAVIPEAPDTGDNISTEGQTEGQAAEGAEEAAPEDEAKKSGAKERREREKRRVAELQERLAAAEAKVAERDQREQRIRAAAEAITPPKEADYPDPFDFMQAKVAWETRRAAREMRVEDAREETQAARAEAAEISRERAIAVENLWQEQVAEAKSRYADFERVAFTAPIADELAPLIKGSEVGADLAYWLGMNPQAAVGLSQLIRSNPVEAARQLGRIEATISAPRPRQTTTAPPPITPVRAKAAPTVDPERMSYADYVVQRKAGKIR